jgi:hypothetical protein
MDSVAAPKAAPTFVAQKPASAEPSIAAEAAAQRMAAHKASLRAKSEPDDLQIRLDDNAQRFVQTLTDSSTGETLRRYPSEAQLAYARAVMAYLRAQLGS